VTYDPQRPLRPQLTDANNEALARPVPWWQRLAAFLARFKGSLARMGGYWGGVTMRDAKRDDKP
jgi:hypothetical protein